MEPEQHDHIKSVIEALLYISEKPVMLEQVQEVLGGIGINDIKEMVEKLRTEYSEQKRGMTIMEIAGGYQMLSNALYVSYVRDFFKTKHKEKLSRPALETLAIIAYKQPVSRLDVELIRGVNSDGVVTHLSSKGLIRIVGRKDVPGKPYIYGTTKQFLEYFGLKSLNDLPKLETISIAQQPTIEESKRIVLEEQNLTQEENFDRNVQVAQVEAAQASEENWEPQANDLREAMNEINEKEILHPQKGSPQDLIAQETTEEGNSDGA